MSIANPLVITLGGSGGTAKSLVRVTQDNYGSEYLLRESTQEFRATIRHSKDTVGANALPLERHTMKFTWTVYGSAGEPDTIREVYTVLRSNKADDADDIADLGTAMSYLLDDTVYKQLIGWVN